MSEKIDIPGQEGSPFNLPFNGNITRAQWNFHGDRKLPELEARRQFPSWGATSKPEGWGRELLSFVSNTLTPSVSPAMQASLSRNTSRPPSSRLARFYQQGMANAQMAVPQQYAGVSGYLPQLIQMAGPLMAAALFSGSNGTV